MPPDVWNQLGELFKNAWPVIGPLVGLLVGAKLSRSGDRKKWLNDCRKDEFKELATTLTKASIVLLQEYDGSRAAKYFMSPEELSAPHDSYMKSLQVLKDRIFIADDLETLKIYERWTAAMKY
jgi:hypothetical protein